MWCVDVYAWHVLIIIQFIMIYNAHYSVFSLALLLAGAFFG